ncbi:hypothetical protein K438DRAFT_1986900 [Mycena galopus ATCC 62051]|nr:hypothetical protein K438DRAFT_1986900 [Mycena galopus ATCC 62051]
MKASTTLVALLSLASVAVSSTIPARGAHISTCPASDRVLVETHTITAGAHEFQVSTKACSADVLASDSAPRARETQSPSTETQTYTCVVGEGEGPLYTDCVALANAITATYGTNYEELFTVEPQFVQEFSLGTCLFAWINENPVGGAYLEYCYTGLAEVLAANIDSSCIINGDTGGYVIPSGSNLVPASIDWVFEVLIN